MIIFYRHLLLLISMLECCFDEALHKNVCSTYTVCICAWVCMHDTSILPLRAAVLFSALVRILHTRPTRPSVCQCLSALFLFFFLFLSAAWLCTCYCAICATSWCLVGIILFCPEPCTTLPVWSASTILLHALFWVHCTHWQVKYHNSEIKPSVLCELLKNNVRWVSLDLECS